jgi:hypothetical protein
MTNDITKLPKWAQEHIAGQDREIKRLKAAAIIGPDDADTFHYDILSGQRNPIGKGVRILFNLDDGSVISAYARGTHLEVTSQGIEFKGSLAVQSKTSNSLQLIPQVMVELQDALG